MTLTCHFDNIECVVMILRASMEHELTMVYIIIKLYLHVFVTHTPTREISTPNLIDRFCYYY